jgi:RimJ/RimL family protein N-acetyltransferase
MNPDVLTTPRLRLTPLGVDDLAGVHALYSDPGTWRHLPGGRHTSPDQTERMLHDSDRSRAASGLGRWAVRLRAPLPGTDLAGGALIGVASATLLDCGAHNLGYRLTPASWGSGLATEAATAVLAAAGAADLPVTARAVRANPASVRVLERIGLTEVWSGSDLPGRAPLDRVIFADRPLTENMTAALIRLG